MTTSLIFRFLWRGEIKALWHFDRQSVDGWCAAAKPISESQSFAQIDRGIGHFLLCAARHRTTRIHPFTTTNRRPLRGPHQAGGVCYAPPPFVALLVARR